MASMSALTSTEGRLFYVMDEGSRVSIQLPPDWKLIARDAFNGVILWKREIPKWHHHLWPLGEHERDDVTLGHADRVQQRRDPVDLRIELGPAELAAVAEQRRSLPTQLGDAPEDGTQRELGEGRIREHGPV